MIEKLKYQFTIANYRNVIKIANDLLKQESYNNDYTVLMYKAASYANLMEDENAISVYQSIIDNYPNLVEPRIRIVEVQIEIGQYDVARNHLSHARAIEPENLDVINNQIYISEQLHEFQKVIDLSTEAIEIDETETSVWLTRASARERMQDYELAIKDGLKAISLSRNDEIYLQLAYNDLGYTYLKKGDYLNAELYLRKAIEVDETEPLQYNNLGLVLALCGKVDEGLKYINHSINIDHLNSYAYKNRAKVYLMKGNKNKARKDLEKAKDMDYHIDYDNEVNELLLTL